MYRFKQQAQPAMLLKWFQVCKSMRAAGRRRSRILRARFIVTLSSAESSMYIPSI